MDGAGDALRLFIRMSPLGGIEATSGGICCSIWPFSRGTAVNLHLSRRFWFPRRPGRSEAGKTWYFRTPRRLRKLMVGHEQYWVQDYQSSG